jgi:hypothetical protein
VINTALSEASMNRLNLFRLVLGLTLGSAACSSDSKDNKGNAGSSAGSSAGAGGSAAGSSAGKSGAGSGAAGAGNHGSVTEGQECALPADCASGLSCVISGIVEPDQSVAAVRICARACGSEADCDQDETCQTLTNKPADAHCWKLQTEPLKPCGPSDTSMCAAPLDCFHTSDDGNVPLGICFNYCKSPGGTNPQPDVVLEQCPDSLDCVGGSMTEVGICAHGAKRGDACNPDVGSVCLDSSDFCLGMSAGGDAQCLQNCTGTNKCDDGKTCTVIQNDPDNTSYCE